TIGIVPFLVEAPQTWRVARPRDFKRGKKCCRCSRRQQHLPGRGPTTRPQMLARPGRDLHQTANEKAASRRLLQVQSEDQIRQQCFAPFASYASRLDL